MTVEDYMEAVSHRYDLSKGAKCLLYDLIMVWNDWHEKGIDWDGYFYATDRGEGKYVIGERWGTDTYARYRKELIEKGCIEYDRGYGGGASRYKLFL